MGEWYVWSPESTESGLQWHVNPGRVSGPRGGEKKAQAKKTREGRREAGTELPRDGGESSVQIHGLSLGLTNASGICLIPDLSQLP